MPFRDMTERLLALRTPAEIAVAPDGDAIAFSVHPAAAETGSHLPSEVWLLRGDGPADPADRRRQPGLVARRRAHRLPLRPIHARPPAAVHDDPRRRARARHDPPGVG